MKAPIYPAPQRACSSQSWYIFHQDIFQYTVILWLILKSCPALCNLMDCSPPGSSVHGISLSRLLEWVAISFSRGSSQARDWTHIGRRILYHWATREVHAIIYFHNFYSFFFQPTCCAYSLAACLFSCCLGQLLQLELVGLLHLSEVAVCLWKVCQADRALGWLMRII